MNNNNGSGKTADEFLDFIIDKARDEIDDAGEYMTWAAECSVPEHKEILTKIANEELGHQKMLIEILGNMARRAL